MGGPSSDGSRRPNQSRVGNQLQKRTWCSLSGTMTSKLVVRHPALQTVVQTSLRLAAQLLHQLTVRLLGQSAPFPHVHLRSCRSTQSIHETDGRLARASVAMEKAGHFTVHHS